MATNGSSLKIRQYVYKDRKTRNRRIKPNAKTGSTQQDSQAQQMMSTLDPNEFCAAAFDTIRTSPEVGDVQWTKLRPPHNEMTAKFKSTRSARISVLPHASSPRAVMSSNDSLLSSAFAQGQDEKLQGGPSWRNEQERGVREENMQASSLHTTQEAYQALFRENDEMRTSSPQTIWIPPLPGLMPDYYSSPLSDTEYVRLTSGNPMQFLEWPLNSYQLFEGEQSHCAEPTQEYRGLDVEPRGLRSLSTQLAKLVQVSNSRIGNTSSNRPLQTPSESIGISIPSSFSGSYSMSRTKDHTTHRGVADTSPVPAHSAGYSGHLVWLPPMVPLRVPKHKCDDEEAEELDTDLDPYSSPSKQVDSSPREAKRQRVDAESFCEIALSRGCSQITGDFGTTPQVSSENHEENNWQGQGLQYEDAAVEGFNVEAQVLDPQSKYKKSRKGQAVKRTRDKAKVTSQMQLATDSPRDPTLMSYISPIPVLVPLGERASPSQSQHFSTGLGSPMGSSSYDGASASLYRQDPVTVDQGKQPEAGLFQDPKYIVNMEVTDYLSTESQPEHPPPSYHQPPIKRRRQRTKTIPRDMLRVLSTNIPGSSNLASTFLFPSQVERTDGQSSDTRLRTTPVERDDSPIIDPLPEDFDLGPYSAVVSQTEVQPQDRTPAEMPREQDVSFDHSLEWSQWNDKLGGLSEELREDIGQPEEVSEEDFLRFLEDLEMYSSFQGLFSAV